MLRAGGALLVLVACSSTSTPTTTQSPSSSTSSTATSTTAVVTTSTTTTPVTTTTIDPSTSTTAPAPGIATFVVFMPRGLPVDFVDRAGLIDGITAVGLVRTETLHIVETRTADQDIVDKPDDGFVIPVQGAAVEPDDHAALLTPPVAALLAGLATDEVLLSEGSAALRRIGKGGTIVFDTGREVTVVAVVPDTSFGAEEIVTTDVNLVGGPGSELRFAIVGFAGSEDDLRQAMSEALPEGAGFGIHPRGQPEDQATAVRSQAWVKQTFGEFAYRSTGEGRFTIDPAWIEENIVLADIPLLGGVRCHRRYVEILTDVMNSLLEAGHDNAIDRSAFLGCWNARYVANSMRLSRHAWGAAADINFFNSLDGGPGSPVHAGLLEAMAEFGVTSGHSWSIPDPGHFEYYGFPEDE